MERAVAIINVDICIIGDILTPKASPILKQVFADAIKAVPSTNDPNESYYDFLSRWLSEGEKTENTTVEEHIKLLGSGSDHAAFAFYAGIPALYFSFRTDDHKYPNAGYPTYHTGFETFYLQSEILDPNFLLHRSCAQVSIHMLLNLGESSILPMEPKYFVQEVDKGMKAFKKNNIIERLESNHPKTKMAVASLKAAINDFGVAVSSWESRRDKLAMTTTDPLTIRQHNDQIMKLERVWLMSKGLPGRPEIRHSIFSPAKFNAYNGAAFPGISDLLHDEAEMVGDEKEKRWKEIHRHLSDLMIIFRQAAAWLSPVHDVL